MAKNKNEDSTIRICIIWDNEQFPEWLLGIATGKVYDRKSFDKQNYKEFDLIYLLAEPKWKGNLRAGFYGFDLANELREKHRVLCPIVFCSFLKQEHLEKLKIKNAQILKYPGHYFLQLPDSPTPDLYHSIDEDTLEDINLSLFNGEQILHNLMHNTEDALPGLIYCEKEREVMKRKAIELIQKHLKIFGEKVESEKISDFLSLCKDLIDEIGKTIESLSMDSPEILLAESQKLRATFGLFKPRFYALLPTQLQDGLIEKVTPKRWQVIFIDDIQENCLLVKEYFKENGITCHTALNAKQAFEKLKEDEGGLNKISIIIADFRLYENGDYVNGKWQDYQGYRILDEIHSNPEFNSHYTYAILTSKTGTIQKQIRKQSKFPILWFSKSDVLGGGISSFNLFCREIENIGSYAFFKKQIIPDTATWQNGIKGRIVPGLFYFYKLHIESQDYYEAEQGINRQATDNIIYALSHDKILNAIDIQCSLICDFHYTNYEVLSFSNTLLKKFRDNILLPRRIFWILSLLEGKSINEIISIFDRDQNMIKAIFNTSLGITLSEIEKINNPDEYYKLGILLEELAYLNSYAKIYSCNTEKIEALEAKHFNYELIQNFFDEVEEISDFCFPLFKSIYDRLITKKSIKKMDLHKCLQQINKLLEQDTLLNEKFIKETKYFFKDNVMKLPEDIRKEFLRLLTPGY